MNTNETLNREYIKKCPDINEALDYTQEVYNIISKPTIYGTGKRHLNNGLYDEFMEFKHNIVGKCLIDTCSPKVGPNRFTELEMRMAEATPQLDKRTLEVYLQGESR